jgi:hypothetical protein
MYEYAIDNRCIMRRAYAGLVAGDLSSFVKPIAPGVVRGVLDQVLHPFAVDVVDLRVDPLDFTSAPGRVRVAGLVTATRRDDRAGVAASFCHEWRVSYGVAWRFEQNIDVLPSLV